MSVCVCRSVCECVCVCVVSSAVYISSRSVATSLHSAKPHSATRTLSASPVKSYGGDAEVIQHPPKMHFRKFKNRFGLEWEVWAVCCAGLGSVVEVAAGLPCADADAAVDVDVDAASFNTINSNSICSAESSLSSAPAWSVLKSTIALIKFRITSILKSVFKYVSIS